MPYIIVFFLASATAVAETASHSSETDRPGRVVDPAVRPEPRKIDNTYIQDCLNRVPVGKKVFVRSPNGLDFHIEREPSGFSLKFKLGFALDFLPENSRKVVLDKLDAFIGKRFKPFFREYGMKLQGEFFDRASNQCGARNCVKVGLTGIRGTSFHSLFWNVLGIDGKKWGDKVMGNLCLHEFIHLFGAPDNYGTARAKRDDIMTGAYEKNIKYKLYANTASAMLGQICGRRR